MKSETVVLFDIGGVLVQASGIRALHTLMPHVANLDDVAARWHASIAVSDFECGRCTPNAFARAFIEEWGIDMTQEVFLSAFASWVKGFYPGAAQLLAELRPHYRVACLSNSNCVHWERLAGIEDLFDHTFVSHRSGFMKPDPRAYEHAMTAMNVAPRQVHFFDDLHPNIEAARALGITAHQVAGVAEVRDALHKAELL